jgi:hypothetical protein
MAPTFPDFFYLYIFGIRKGVPTFVHKLKFKNREQSFLLACKKHHFMIINSGKVCPYSTLFLNRFWQHRINQSSSGQIRATLSQKS